MNPAATESAPTGLEELRRSGAVTELLFLYACATLEPTQLRPVAERLRITVQAVSHSYRQLRRRGLVTVSEGRYRPTVEGVAWLHRMLGGLSDDLSERLDHLHVIRSTRAIAATDLPAHAPVSLELDHGLLTARAGSRGASRGRVARAARAGALVEVEDLEGIVALAAAAVEVRTLTEEDLADPGLAARLGSALPAPPRVVAALGLEAYVALRAARVEPVERFAVVEVAREASRIGVPVTIVVLERDLPHLLSDFARGEAPRLVVEPLARRFDRGRTARRATGARRR